MKTKEIDVLTLKKELEAFDEIRRKRERAFGVIQKFGQEGRNGQIGKWQNNYNNKLQIAIQYTEGGTNYWGDQELDKAFNQAVKNNFNMLLEEANNTILNEYKEKEKVFSKYKIVE